MSDEDYALAQNQLLLMAGLIAGTDWAGFIARIEHTESAGFLVAPTPAFTLALPRLQKLRHMAAQAQRLAALHAELAALVGAEEGSNHLALARRLAGVK